jgi:hypothetical protein
MVDAVIGHDDTDVYQAGAASGRIVFFSIVTD